MKKKERECSSYFFSDHYRYLNLEEREEFKKELYKNKPHIKEWFSDIGIMKSRLGNRGCNLRIQGTSAKQSKLAQMKMRHHSIIHPELGWEICLLLHDEVVSEVPENTSQTVYNLQEKYMIEAANYFCPDIKFNTEGKIGKIWNH